MADSPPISTGTDMSSIVSDPGEKDIVRRSQAREDQINEKIEGKIKDIDSLKPPEMPKMPDSPKQSDYDTDPMKTFGSAAMWMATFGSLLTRHPLTTALNAGAEVNKAAAAGDAAAYKNAMDKWKTQSDYALKLSQYDMDRYKESVSKGDADIRAYSSMMKNDTARLAMDMKQNDAHLKDSERQNKLLEEGFKAQALKAQYDYADMAVADAKAQAQKEGKPFTDLDAARIHDKAIGNVKNWESGKTTKNDQLDQLANYDWDKAKPDDAVPGTGATVGSIKTKAAAVLAGATPSKAGLGYGTNPISAAVYDYIGHTYPSFNMAQAQLGYGEKVRELNSIATLSAPVRIAVHEIDTLAPPMVNAVKALNPTDYPDFNALENAVKKKTGSPEVVAAYNAVQAYKNAMTQLLTKGSQSTDAARDKVDALVNLSFSTKQIDAVVAQSKVEAMAVVDALSGAKEDVTGPDGKPVEKIEKSEEPVSVQPSPIRQQVDLKKRVDDAKAAGYTDAEIQAYLKGKQ